MTDSTEPRSAEAIAKAICMSGKFECGQGCCAPICMENLGSARGKCGRCLQVHGKLTEAIMAALPRPTTDTVEREKVEALVEQAENWLLLATVASCECLTKTPNVEAHEERCRYRLITQASESMAAIRALPSAGGGEVGKTWRKAASMAREWATEASHDGADDAVIAELNNFADACKNNADISALQQEQDHD